MAVVGAHTILYSRNAEADRSFLRDVLNFPHVDAGGGWLLFGLPASEVAVHPGEVGGDQEFYLMVDDIDAFVAEMTQRGRPTGAVLRQRWGVLSSVELPSGHILKVYQPLHPRP